MKKFLLRFTVFWLTFGITLVVASRVLNKDRDNLIGDMPDASLPLMNMYYGDVAYNRMVGYTVPMDIPVNRGCITILGENRRTWFGVKTFGRNVTAICAEVRSADGERLIETIDVTDYQLENDEIRGSLAPKDLIEKDQEYVLTIILELDGWEEVRYYTRIIWNPESELTSHLAFVMDFHKKLYQREEARELIKYLESNSKLESNESFHKVNIHSSFKQITWGDMHVREVTAPIITLREINSKYSTIILDYHLIVDGPEPKMLCRMQEYFRLKYTSDRMYLLDYERTMTQIPDEENFLAADKILLGIGDENVKMMESANGSVLAFEQADRLFSYRSSDQKLVSLFSFYDGTTENERNCIDQHDIRILHVDDDGSVMFAVYGYMNRGDHEGQVGIRLCRYDSAVNTVAEQVFIPWRQPYEVLKPQMDTLLYLGGAEQIYLLLNNSVYEVNYRSKEYKKLFDVMMDGALQVADDNRILVWQEGQNGEYSNELKILDLQLGKSGSVKGKSGEEMKVLGFMGQDIIYGVARKEQIGRTSTGKLFFPMYKLVIADSNGKTLKEYEQEDAYISECRIEENQIVLDRMILKSDGTYTPTGQDHITKNQQDQNASNHIAVVDIDTYEKYLQIQVAGKVDENKLQHLTPKEVVREGSDEIRLELSDERDLYYVCGPYGVEEIDTSVGNAVERANLKFGTVLSDKGLIIWQKGNRVTRNQIMSIKDPERCTVSESLAVCLDTMLRYRGITADSASLLENGKIAADILKERMTDTEVIDMTGCSLDAMLYYVNQEIPVLAELKDGEAVLITGFNDTQVVIFRPAEGKLVKRSMNDAAKWFEESGNGFLTYLVDF